MTTRWAWGILLAGTCGAACSAGPAATPAAPTAATDAAADASDAADTPVAQDTTAKLPLAASLAVPEFGDPVARKLPVVVAGKQELARLKTGAEALAGLELGPDGKLCFVDSGGKVVVRVAL